jgi:hypothetical protein
MVVNVAYDLYKQMRDNMVAQSRGYIGDKIEAEITCATTPGYTSDAVGEQLASKLTYKDFTASVTRNDKKEVTAASVTTTADAVEYGAVAGDGTLVNEGEIVYTADSWDAYVEALAVAVETATDQEAQVSKVYTAKTALQRAENNLEELEAEDDSTITVSGTITIATNTDGTAGTVGIIGIKVQDPSGNVLATSAADGTFTAVVPAGVTELTITGPTTIDRTVTIAEGATEIKDVVIPIVVCDYNKDGYVTGLDSGTFSAALNGSYNVYCDLNGDGDVTGLDTGTYSAVFNKTIAYASVELK